MVRFVCSWAALLLLPTKCTAFNIGGCMARHPNEAESMDRRSVLTMGGRVGSLLAVLVGSPQMGHARDELFKPNPLTNPLLEKIRILEQAEADDIRYGGELTPGDAGNRGQVDAYPRLLVPILKMEQELQVVDRLVHGSQEDWKRAAQILQQSQYDKVAFKKIFNAYADNIYYGDPDRANLYLGGGATPKSEQSLAYLLRNELLTNIEALQAELDYLLKEPEDGTEDLLKYSALAKSAMVDYLRNVSPSEMTKAKELLELET